ncbi:transposase [Donghicola eburneus]|nr:transposase [Donghicola eburneus]
MSTENFTDDFKRDAVALITERGYPVRKVSERLGVSKHSFYAWKRELLRVTEERNSLGNRFRASARLCAI